MKKYIFRLPTIVLMAFLALAFHSCDEDDTENTLAPGLTQLEEVTFAQPITTTPNNIVLTSDNGSASVVTISWEAVKFPVPAPVTYTVQIDLPANTLGDNGWANAFTLEAGEDVLSISLTGNELNEIAEDFGLAPDAVGELAIRVRAFMGRSAFSEAVSINVRPFVNEIPEGTLYMPGAYNGFDPSTASRLTAIGEGVFRGYLTLREPQGLVFKITPEPNFDQFYGLGADGNLELGNDTDIAFPDFGSYEITANLNDLSITITPFSWGVIGPATLGGWDADTNMVYNYTLGLWEYTGALVPGPIKFRQNDEWTINYGTEDGNTGEVTESKMFLDNPGAHTMSDAGFYTVSFSVDQDSDTATYSVVAVPRSFGVIGPSTPAVGMPIPT